MKDHILATQSIRIALPSKGHLYEGVIDLLKTAGYKVKRASDRQYEATIAGHPRFEIVFMRPTDIVVQVRDGRCCLGVTGFDVFAERAAESEHAVIVVRDLGYGGCRLAAAVPESWVDVTHILDLADLIAEYKAAGKAFRISTKYPGLVRTWLRGCGIYHYTIVESDGALELHPSLGIADVIVDLTSSGTTLKDNRLREIEGGTVLESSACLIGHAPTLATLISEGESSPLAVWLDALDGARASDGLLHLEAAGARVPHENEATGSDTPASAAAAYLMHIGAQHVVRGEVWSDDGEPGWRVTALIPIGRFSECRRPLIRLGASRVVGLPIRFVFGKEGRSTFDDLKAKLERI